MKQETIKVKGESKPIVRQEFSSLMDLKDYIIANSWEKYKNHIENIQKDPRFYGTKSFETALHELQFGKKDMTKKYLDAVKDDSKLKANMICDSFKLSEQGTIYDIGSVIAGVPECCIEDAPLPMLRRKITIYLDMGYMGHVDAKCIDNRGIAVYNFINTLIRENYIVDVYLLTSTNCMDNDEANVMQVVRVTNINNRPLLPHLAFGCTSAYFRAINWIVMGMPFKDYSGRKTWEYARSNVPKSMRDDWLKQNIFYIGGGYTNEVMQSCSVEQAEKEIIRLFKGFKEGKDLNKGGW